VIIVAIFRMSMSVSATESTIIHNIVKIKNYEARSDGSYVFKSYGSAIAISPSRILTNAHVIMGSDDIPTGHYEVCISTDFERVPVCRDTARLMAYDSVADLALLELSHTKSLSPFVFASSKIAIGSYVSMYGYPAIGGDTITRTDGKIAGYEQMMYKIDGSIDRGNSGGGAFNSSWELIGIPTAVASDNASIGYMIPIRRIADFLDKRTSNYEIYTENLDRFFTMFLTRIQSYIPSKAIYRWKMLTLQNSRPYGFTLRSSMISLDNKMATWTFSDASDRVSFAFSCTDDAGIISGWQARRDGLKKEQETSPDRSIRAIDDDRYLTIVSSSRSSSPSTILYYKYYDACYAEISYVDTKKDIKSLEKALKYLKKWATFRSDYLLPSSQENPYFSLKTIEKDTRIIRSITQYGAISVLLSFEILPGNWLNATLEQKEYATPQELGTTLDMDFDQITTWDQYISAIADFGISRSEIMTLDLWVNQKGVLVARYNSEKKSTNITFQYVYQTTLWRYAYWSWSVVLPWERSPDLTRLQSLFTSLQYPGQSLFL
jgi:Trypsin-like peptidase domain